MLQKIIFLNKEYHPPTDNMVEPSWQRVIAEFARFIEEADPTKESAEVLIWKYGAHDEQHAESFLSRLRNPTPINNIDFRDIVGERKISSVTIDYFSHLYEREPETCINLMVGMYNRFNDQSAAPEENYPQLSGVAEKREAGYKPEKLTIPFTAEPLLSLEPPPDSIYLQLITDINRCYQIEAYTATLTLCRKLLESLLVDVLRRQYPPGKGHTNIYYDADQGRPQKFSILINNFEDRIEDFKPYSQAIDAGIVRDLNKIRSETNNAVHVLEEEIQANKSHVEGLAEDIEYIARVLFRLRAEIYAQDI